MPDVIAEQAIELMVRRLLANMKCYAHNVQDKHKADAMETLNVVEARRSFSEVMARVAYGGQRVVIERKGRPMMALVSTVLPWVKAIQA